MISMQIADIVRGCKAARVAAELDYFINGHGWKQVGQGVSNDSGRIGTFGEPPAAGIYRLSLDVAAYAPESFFPSIEAVFEVRDASEDCELNVQLSTCGYSVSRS